MPDGWEVGYGLNPLVDDSALDPDGDGYSNLEEYLGGSDPTDPASIPVAVAVPGLSPIGISVLVGILAIVLAVSTLRRRGNKK